MRVTHFVWMLLLATHAASACTHRQGLGPEKKAEEQRPVTLPPAEPTTDRPKRDSLLVDTEEMLIPNPELRTWNRLWSLRNWLRRYQQEHGEFPQRMEEFVPPGDGVDLEHDGWGHAIVYVRTGASYELRAPGPDGKVGTEDDMVATAEQLPPQPDRVPPS